MTIKGADPAGSAPLIVRMRLPPVVPAARRRRRPNSPAFKLATDWLSGIPKRVEVEPAEVGTVHADFRRDLLGYA